MAKKAPAAVTSKTVLDALRRKYDGGDEREWKGGTYIEECGINGNGAQSRCDALYAGYTSDSGRMLIGHEIKVSRSDWLAELKKVGKADFWHDNTHLWYIVCPPGIVGDNELPEGWGLMQLEGGRLVVRERATRRDIVPSWDAVRSFLSRAETLRAASVRRARSEEQQALSQRIQTLQGEIEALKRQAGGYSAQEEQMRRMVAAVRERLGEAQVYTPLEEELVTQAYFDYAFIQDATRNAENRLRRVLQVLEEAAEGVGRPYGTLRKFMEKEKVDG